MFAVLWIRIYYYADPDPGSKKCPYGSGSGRPFLMRIRIRNTASLHAPMFIYDFKFGDLKSCNIVEIISLLEPRISMTTTAGIL